MKTQIKLTAMALLSGILAVSCRAEYSSVDEYPAPSEPIQEYVLSGSGATFSLWSPGAEAVKLRLYAEDLGGEPLSEYNLRYGKEGIWKVTVKDADIQSKFYTFDVLQGGEWQGETTGPYARAVGRNGLRAAAVDLTKAEPEGWADDKSPRPDTFADIVLYEMHHRDFSAHANSGISAKGKFIALTEQGTTNPLGDATGIDHLKALGVTHVHILPSYDYGSIDETTLEKGAYNWGYDPVNYNVPEGSYSTDPANPLTRIREFRSMVQALHKAGICVVLDVVYNHVYDAGMSPFQKCVPGYYFRYREDGSYGDASGCGNETASDREMMRKYMIQSVVYWAQEYHIDGFRFDLMGIHDIETMNQIRAALNQVDPRIFIYGEGWAAQAPLLPEGTAAMKSEIYRIPGVAAFSDEIRDCLRGNVFNDREGAFIIGVPGHEEGIKFGLCGAIENPVSNNPSALYSDKPWAGEPTQMISYVSCHDDMCIADRIKTTLKVAGEKAGDKEVTRLVKLAYTAVLTSQGVPFIFAGDEVLRDKQGVHNSFCSPDSINAIDWNLKTEHKDLFDYMSGLISIRKAHKSLHQITAEAVRKGVRFLDVPASNIVAFEANHDGDTVVVVLNASKKAQKINIPEGDYIILAKDGAASKDGLGTCRGGLTQVGARSALILSRN